MKSIKGNRKAALHKVTEQLTHEFRANQDGKNHEKVLIELISYNEELSATSSRVPKSSPSANAVSCVLGSVMPPRPAAKLVNCVLWVPLMLPLRMVMDLPWNYG